MPAPIDETGNRYVRLVVMGPDGRTQHGKLRWRCRCDCGAEVSIVGSDLRSGRTTSCGCRRIDVSTRKATVHGGCGTRLYGIYRAMISRCSDPRDPNYRNYGGRGIHVCIRWTGPEGFEHFRADMGQRPLGLTLDRRNNDGDYTPQNCRWATYFEQAANRRRSVDPETVIAIREAYARGLPIAEIARLHGTSWSTTDRIAKLRAYQHIS